MQPVYLKLASQLADQFAQLSQVTAVALGGSRGREAGSVDPSSDIDLYVYTRAAIPLENRQKIVEQTGGATRSDLDLNYWGPGDEWIHAPSGIEVDIVYFDQYWMEEQIDRVLYRHQANAGYTTCFWYTIRHSLILADPEHWFANLQDRCQVEYPEPLRRNIVALNHPLLRGIIPAYAHQLEKAVQRRDLISINHRLAALLASYFDILFAVNRLLHPGEKRLVEFALVNCSKLPESMETDLTAVLQSATSANFCFLTHLIHLLDRLDDLLRKEGFR